MATQNIELQNTSNITFNNQEVKELYLNNNHIWHKKDWNQVKVVSDTIRLSNLGVPVSVTMADVIATPSSSLRFRVKIGSITGSSTNIKSITPSSNITSEQFNPEATFANTVAGSANYAGTVTCRYNYVQNEIIFEWKSNYGTLTAVYLILNNIIIEQYY